MRLSLFKKVLYVVALLLFFTDITRAENVLKSKPLSGNLPTITKHEQTNDTTTLNNLLNLGKLTCQNSLMDLEHAENFAKEKGLIHYYLTKVLKTSDKENKKGHYQTALILNFNGIKQVEKLKDTLLITEFYNNIGIVYNEMEDYDNAIRYNLKALQLAEQINDSVNLSLAHTCLGNSYIGLKKYSVALEHFKKSLKIENESKNLKGVALNLKNIGNVYLMKRDYDEALRCNQLSVDISKKINDISLQVESLSNIAELYGHKRDFKQALAYNQKALILCKQFKDTSLLAKTHIKRAIFYLKNKQVSNSIIQLNKGISYAKIISSDKDLLTAYQLFIGIYRQKKDYKKALDYNVLAHKYHNKLLNNGIRKNMALIRIQFETQEKESQILLLNQKNKMAQESMKKEIILIYFLTGLSLLLIFFIGLLFWFIHTNKKKNKELIIKNDEIERVKNKLEENRKELIIAHEEAKRNAMAKSRFLAQISHEIRTPLNSVLGYTDLLNNSIKDPEQKNHLNSITASSKSLLHLLNNILDFTKYENNQMNSKWEEVNLKEVLTEVKNIFSLKASEKNLFLDISYKNIFCETILFNQMILQQILLNLIGNAIKYTQKGGVEIILSQKKSTIKNKIALILEIKDTGIGMNEHELNYIFEPFYQIEHTHQQEGAGLGLSITQTLVKNLNGTIQVKSKPNKGTQFILHFNEVLVDTDDLSKRKQIIVHDEKTNSTVLFINNTNELKPEITVLFNKYHYKFLNVGVRLTEVKKHLMTTPIIILYKLSDDELKNTLNLIENQDLSEQKKILIITDKKINLPNSDQITVLYDDHDDTIINLLEQFIIDYREGVQTLNLFLSKTLEKDNPQIIEQLKLVYNQEYKEAFTSKMMDKIIILSKKLDWISVQFQMPYLSSYVNQLKGNIKLFDIVAIDKQLNQLSKIFETVYHFR